MMHTHQLLQAWEVNIAETTIPSSNNAFAGRSSRTTVSW